MVFANLFGGVAECDADRRAGDWEVGAADLPVIGAYGLFSIRGHGLNGVRAAARRGQSLLAPFSYTQIVWSTAYGMVLFGQGCRTWRRFWAAS